MFSNFFIGFVMFFLTAAVLIRRYYQYQRKIHKPDYANIARLEHELLEIESDKSERPPPMMVDPDIMQNVHCREVFNYNTQTYEVYKTWIDSKTGKTMSQREIRYRPLNVRPAKYDYL